MNKSIHSLAWQINNQTDRADGEARVQTEVACVQTEGAITEMPPGACAGGALAPHGRVHGTTAVLAQQGASAHAGYEVQPRHRRAIPHPNWHPRAECPEIGLASWHWGHVVNNAARLQGPAPVAERHLSAADVCRIAYEVSAYWSLLTPTQVCHK